MDHLDAHHARARRASSRSTGHQNPATSGAQDHVELQVGGGYLLGEGDYDVRWMMLDDMGPRVPQSWRVDVRRSRAESPGQGGHAAGHGVGTRAARVANHPAETDDAPPLRLTVFLHTAPLFPRRTRLRPNDIDDVDEHALVSAGALRRGRCA